MKTSIVRIFESRDFVGSRYGKTMVLSLEPRLRKTKLWKIKNNGI